MRSAVVDQIEANTRTYAGLISRLTALGVDVIALTVICLSVSVLPGLAWHEVIGRSPGWLGAVSGTVAAVLPWAYFTCCWRLTGQTAGSLLIGVAVRRDNGRRLSFIRSALRAAIGLALAPLWLLGLIVILWSPRRQALHDILFRTVVCATPREPAGPLIHERA